jgi:hypothetical protein
MFTHRANFKHEESGAALNLVNVSCCNKECQRNVLLAGDACFWKTQGILNTTLLTEGK